MESTSTNDQPEERQNLKQVVNEAVAQGKLDRALQLAMEGVQRFEVADDLAGQALALNLVGKCYRLLNDLSASVEKHQESYERYTAIHDLSGSAEALRMKAITLRFMGEVEEAVRALFQSRDLCRQVGDKALEMRTLTSLSGVYKQAGNIAASQELLFECLAYFEEYGPASDAAPVLANIASNYNNIDDPARAVPFIVRAVRLEEAAENMRGVSMSLCILGNSYLTKGDHETALEQFRAALQIAEHVDNRAALPIALNGISTIAIERKRFEEAREALERSVQVNRGDDFRLAYGDNLVKLGELYANPEYAGRDVGKALGYLEQAERLAKEHDYVTLFVDTYQALTGLHERNGDYVQALEAFRGFHAAKMRLINEDTSARIKRLEVEKAEKEAEITRLRVVELAQALEEAERLRMIADEWAHTDPLTGMLNRRALDEHLEEEFARSRRYDRSLAIALVDVDHFKRVNDTLGHGVGDNVLLHVAHLLHTRCGSGNRIARYGGEEFALLFPETSLEIALDLCECLREAIAAEDWTKIHPGLPLLTVSIGVGVINKDNQDRIDTPTVLLDEADKNLYQAKRGGRNRVVG